MNKGHENAQYYRIDFVDIIINEMVIAHGGEINKDNDNETAMKGLFG